jgi:IS5 family transposase
MEMQNFTDHSPLTDVRDTRYRTPPKRGARDSEMSSTRKVNDWYFGIKAHIGVDADSCVTHSLETLTAKLHDSQVWDGELARKPRSGPTRATDVVRDRRACLAAG